MAQKNVTVVYDVATRKPSMVVIDANDLTDPSFNPPGSAQLSIDIALFNSMNADDLQQYLATEIPQTIVAAEGS